MVEDQERIGRIRDLLQMPASQRWACFEPLLGPVRPDAVPVGEGYVDALFGGCYRLDGRGRRVPISGPVWRPLDWVVGGGEIGPGARPSHPDWVRGLRDGCIAAGLPFLFKQWGEWCRPMVTGSATGWCALGAAPRAVWSTVALGTSYRRPCIGAPASSAEPSRRNPPDFVP